MIVVGITESSAILKPGVAHNAVAHIAHGGRVGFDIGVETHIVAGRCAPAVHYAVFHVETGSPPHVSKIAAGSDLELV